MRLILLFCLFVFAAEAKTICLNMIVKNESPVIERCLASVKGTIDYWVIVDTGSTDGTQQVIRDFMKDIPGELHERPWVNFGHNRNEALDLARGKSDYILFIDADEVLETAAPLDKAALADDLYLVNVRISDETKYNFLRTLLISNRLHWSWKNVLHEKLVSKESTEVCGFIPNVAISAVSKEGARSCDPQKHLKDALLLEQALKDDPNNEEYVYYLAQSYNNCQKYDLAIQTYEKRADMPGWDQHAFWSRYYAGVLREQIGMPAETFLSNYSKAFEMRPTRAEPLYRLADYYYKTGHFALSYILAKYAETIPLPNDIVYVDKSAYDFGIRYTLANAALQLGRLEEAKTAYEQVLKQPGLFQDCQQTAERNLLYINLTALREKTENITPRSTEEKPRP